MRMHKVRAYTVRFKTCSDSDVVTEPSTHALIRPRGYKTFFMLNSVEHEIFPAHEC